MKFSVAALALIALAAAEPAGNLRNKNVNEQSPGGEGRELWSGGSGGPSCVWGNSDTCPNGGTGWCDADQWTCEGCGGWWHPTGCSSHKPAAHHKPHHPPAHHQPDHPPPPHGGWQSSHPPHHPHHPPAHAHTHTLTDLGKVDPKYVDEKLKFGEDALLFKNGPFKVTAKCVEASADSPGDTFESIFNVSNAVEIEVMASAMDEPILVYGVGYTVFPGFLSERVVKQINPGTSEDYRLFRVSDFFRIIDVIDPPLGVPNITGIPQGFVANNPFNGAFSSSNGYHVGVDGDSCTGVVRSDRAFGIPIPPEAEIGDELDEFYGEDEVDCIISCIFNNAEPKKVTHSHHPW